MVPSGAQEDGRVPHSLSDLKAQDIHIEPDGALEVRDLEVYMADHRTGRDRMIVT
jgi:hypothetical protein